MEMIFIVLTVAGGGVDVAGIAVFCCFVLLNVLTVILAGFFSGR